MTRPNPALAASVALLALPTMGAAQPSDAPALTYRLGVGGLHAGTFTTLNVPTHTVALNGKDVAVTPRSVKADKRPITLTGGTVGAMATRILKDKTGQQMTVTISVLPVNVAPGIRCTFNLDHAKLKKFDHESFSFEPSELPKFDCK